MPYTLKMATSLVDVYFQDENYLEFIFEDGKYYSATIFGNGDFTHHQANFEIRYESKSMSKG